MCYRPLHFVTALCEHASATNKESQNKYTTTATSRKRDEERETQREKKEEKQSWRLVSLQQLLCLLFSNFIFVYLTKSDNATRLKSRNDSTIIR